MSLKLCGKCEERKFLRLFNWKNRELRKRHSICRDCHLLYRQKHYFENREKYITKAKRWNHVQGLKLQKVVLDYLSKNQCIDCKEDDVVVLDFDHRTNKTKGVSEMIKSRCSIKRLKAEIEKCDVRCANCHRRKTAKEFGYWKMGM